MKRLSGVSAELEASSLRLKFSVVCLCVFPLFSAGFQLPSSQYFSSSACSFVSELRRKSKGLSGSSLQGVGMGWMCMEFFVGSVMQ